MHESMASIVGRHPCVGSITKAVIWAHNSHVYHEPPVAGSHLRARLGAAYRSVCCVFGRGSFNAGSGKVNAETISPEGQPNWALRPHVAEPPPTESMERVLDQLDIGCYTVTPADVAALHSKLPVRNVGAVVFEGLGQFSHACVPAGVYDLVVYFHEVRPARLLSTGRVGAVGCSEKICRRTWWTLLSWRGWDSRG